MRINAVDYPFRPEAMVGNSCYALAELGHQGIFVSGSGNAAMATHDRKTDLCHGEGTLSGTCSCLHGGHSVGAPRDATKR